MNCPDCDTPMRREDASADGGWPQVSYRCPVCHPEPSASAHLDQVEVGEPREIRDVDTGGGRL